LLEKSAKAGLQIDASASVFSFSATVPLELIQRSRYQFLNFGLDPCALRAACFGIEIKAYFNIPRQRGECGI